jgi:hypothetical protein
MPVNEYPGIILRCAFTTGHSGGSRGHCHGGVRAAYHTHRAQLAHADQPGGRPWRFAKMMARFCVTYHVLSRLPAWRIGIIDHEAVIIEHFSMAYDFYSTVLRAYWLVFPLFLPFRSSPKG